MVDKKSLTKKENLFLSQAFETKTKIIFLFQIVLFFRFALQKQIFCFTFLSDLSPLC